MRHLSRVGLLCAAALVLSACGDDAPDPAAEPDAQETDDGAAADDPADDEPADDMDDTDDTDDMDDADGTAVSLVDDGGFAFDPDEVTVAVGDTVTWTHEGEAPHTVTAGDDTFDSGNLEAGDTFEFTFEEAGSVDYVCEIHPEMTGTVTVE